MDVGDSLDCTLPDVYKVFRIGLSVGCNEPRESGNFTITFDDGSNINMEVNREGSCESKKDIPEKATKRMTLRMNSGGGDDNRISLTCYGSKGWSVDYK